MSWFARYTRSSIGAKQVMAVTGVLLLVFAIVHMLGHLQVFGGRELYNRYATFLQNLWEVKWPVRVGLLALLIIHVVLALRLVAQNRAARPQRYAVYRPVVSSLIGRTMAITGLVVLAFLVFHIWHFTVRPHAGAAAAEGARAAEAFDTYGMYVHAFHSPMIYALYFIGIAKLSAHLGHGASAWLQSLGLRHPKYPTDKLGPMVAILLFVGYMAPPTAILLGAIA
jgi:succinate dehydrogenase / fumarate reductase cytochrome b subunit